MEEERSLEGWQPEPSPELSLGRIIDLAFDYRGNTTVVMVDGRTRDGYVSNRNAETATPFIEMFDADGTGPHRIPYAEIRTIRFTGKDTAAGTSYAAWHRRREQERGGDAAAAQLPGLPGSSDATGGSDRISPPA